LACFLLFGKSSGAAGDDSVAAKASCCSLLKGDVRLTTYILAPGDRLSLLAERFGIENEAVVRCNPAVRPSEMSVGDVIVLPLPRSVRLPRTELSKAIDRGLRGQGRIALTFDVGADVGALDELLAVLRDRGVRSTFFVTGLWVKRHPDALKRIVAGGHEAFNHTFTHPLLPRLTSEQMVEELEKTDRIIQQTLGRRPLPYFRSPFGDFNRRVLNVAGEAGWQCVYWTLDSCDSIGPTKTPRSLVKRVLSPSGIRDPHRFLDGAIILFHAAEPATARAMWPILDGLAEMGLEPVPLTTLLEPAKPHGNNEK